MSESNDKKPDQSHSDLSNELRELGHQLEQTVRGVLESERAQTIQRDISKGLQEIGVQMQHALQSIKDNPRMQQLSERGQQAVNQLQDSQTLKDFQESFARGIAQLNEQLANFTARTQSNASTNQPTSTNAPGDETMPATGETTRLDPDK